MIRKMAVILTMAMILAGVTACGSKGADAAGQNETAAEAQAQDTEDFAEAEPATEPVPEPTTEPTPEPIQEPAPEPVEKPVWYMDSEGLKSEELGMMIRKDSRDWSSFGFLGSADIRVSDTDAKTVITNFDFKCYCYEGDLDSYISENKGMEKSTIGDISFAVREPDEHSRNREIAFVGNGISFLVTLWDYHIEDIWEKGLESYDEADYDYLAYIKDGDLYCPALGIKLYSTDDGHDTSSRGISCSDAHYVNDNGYEGGSVSISYDALFYDTLSAEEKSAQKRLDKWVRNIEKYNEATVSEETVERSVGNCHYTGMYAVSDYGTEMGQFYSDETGWAISVDGFGGYAAEDYLSCIEELK